MGCEEKGERKCKGVEIVRNATVEFEIGFSFIHSKIFIFDHNYAP